MANEQPRSKAIKISGDRRTGVIIKRYRYNPVDSPNSFESAIPDLGESHPYVDGLYFFDADFQPMEGQYGDLILNYSWKKDKASSVEFRTQLKDVPLENHENYRLKWNNTISSETETTAPSWWSDAKSLDGIKNKSDFANYKITPLQGSQPATNIIQKRTKTTNSFKSPASQVLEISYFKDKKDADKKAMFIGDYLNPPDTFGLAVGTLNWLVTSAPVTREGGYWVVRTTYEYNGDKYIDNDDDEKTGWDFDFYGGTQ